MTSQHQVEDSPEATRSNHSPVVPLHSVFDDLDQFVTSRDGQDVTLADVENALRGRGAAVLILVLSMPFIFPIPIPLLATVCGLPMFAIGLRLLFAREPRLPAFAQRHRFSHNTLSRIASGLRRSLMPLAWLYMPRLAPLFWPVAWRMTGLSIALAALMLSLPLPIPFANMIPALALIQFAAGLLQRDGLAILLGHLLTVSGYAYLYWISETVLQLLKSFF
ncbi:exopolysaccharide biosynthesis protein [Mucisphaera sp.]|uniref:exopolysaccharide biosynthesis protein n=1 Tax=Mucisphaera sp. TaxID=2913024 RepID=UPI003D126A80